VDDRENNLKFASKDLKTLFEMDEKTASSTHDALSCKRCIAATEWKKRRPAQVLECDAETSTNTDGSFFNLF
jgi:hypothetical protein